jgi:hypothetical protein
MGFTGCAQAHTNVLKTAKFGTFPRFYLLLTYFLTRI